MINRRPKASFVLNFLLPCKSLVSSFSSSQQIHVKITQSMVKRFSEVSGDSNPLHTDKQYAKKSIFKQRISHGMLPMCFLQQHFTQQQLNIKSMEIKFMKPIYLDEQVLIEVKRYEEAGVNKFRAEIKKTENSSQGSSQVLVTLISGSLQR